MFELMKQFVASVALATIAASINVSAGQGSGGGGGTPPPQIGPTIQVTQEAQLIEANAPEFIMPFQSGHALNADTAAFHAYVAAPAPQIGSKLHVVLVYHRIGNIWNRQAKLSASDPTDNDDLYGSAVSLDGDTLVVSVNNPVERLLVKGVYVYRRVQGVWIEEARLIGSDAASKTFSYGRAVAVSGNTILVGAQGGDGGLRGIRPGAIYAFQRNSLGKWVQSAKIVRSAPDEIYGFGRKFALNGDAFVVPNSQSGASVYRRKLGIWKLETVLKPSDLSPDPANPVNHGWGFGEVLAINSDTILVGGSVDQDVKRNTIYGSAYVFQRSAGIWRQQAKLVPEVRTSSFDDFGSKVSLSGNLALMGYKGLVNTGRASLFARVGEVWTEKLIQSPGVPIERRDKEDFFALSALVDGNTALIHQPLVNPLGREFVQRINVTP